MPANRPTTPTAKSGPSATNWPKAGSLRSVRASSLWTPLIEKQSAKVPGRPVFNEMLDRIEKGEASGIIAWHPDRLARNSLDGGRIIWLVDTGAIKELLFPSFRFDPTPQGELSLAIEFGISKYYVDKLSEDIRRGIRQKLKNGIWPQYAPLGYLNDHVTKTIVVDPEKSPLVRKAFEMYATGHYTLRQVKAAMNDLGLTGKRSGALSTANYQYLLQNPWSTTVSSATTTNTTRASTSRSFPKHCSTESRGDDE